MNLRRFFTILFVLLMSGAVSAQDLVTETATLPILKDATINKKDSTFNFGHSRDLIAMAWTCNTDDCVLRSLIDFDFDVIPAGATILEARLSFYATEGSGNPQHFGFNEADLRRVVSPWEETEVKWINRPVTTVVNRIDLTESTSPEDNYENLDVTEMVIDMYENPEVNHGLMLQLKSESIFRSMNFASGDHSEESLHPKLEVTYEYERSSTGFYITDVIDPGSFEIYPNPAVDRINVRFYISEPINYEFGLFDINGYVVEKIDRGPQRVGERNYRIPVGHLTDGVYFLRIRIDGDVYSRRVIIMPR